MNTLKTHKKREVVNIDQRKDVTYPGDIVRHSTFNNTLGTVIAMCDGSVEVLWSCAPIEVNLNSDLFNERLFLIKPSYVGSPCVPLIINVPYVEPSKFITHTQAKENKKTQFYVSRVKNE